MEAVGLSASIAGLVALADLVFRYSTKYVKGVKGAQKEVKELSREVKELSLILHNLSHVAFELEDAQPSDGAQPTPNLQPHHLHDCQQLLRRLEKGLVDAQSNLDSESRAKRLQGRLTWPFSSSDTKQILQDVQRHKKTIELALVADSLSKLRLLLSRQSLMSSGVDGIKETVKKILDIETKVVLDNKRKEVLEFFTKSNPSSEFDTNRKLRHDLTGLWLTEGAEFEEWYTTPGSRIWCSGIPGAGKSVLAAAIIDECLQRNAADPRTALAYFFCTYRDEDTHEPTSILSSLCFQLALQDENAFQILKEYHDELTSDRQLRARVSTSKLIKVLRTMCNPFRRVYIIIDGLDECGQQVEASVESLAALLPSPDDETLNLALLSRDEIPIRDIVGDRFQNVKIEAHTGDVQLYVASELEQRIASRKLRLRNLSLKDEIMTKLVDGAKGMFRWVACQLDHLCELPTDRARRQALDRLPPTLFATYERILSRINSSHEQVRQLVQRTLLLISSPYHKYLSLRQICEAISLQDDWDELLDDDIVDQEEVLRLCGSLVRARKMPYYYESRDEVGVEFSHFSVQEYLQDNCLKHPTLSAYGVSRQKACHLLASLCLSCLTLNSNEQLLAGKNATIEAMNERDSRHPFYRHAATCWLFYVREAGEGCCLERIHELFRLPKTPNFSTWAATIAAHSAAKINGRRYPDGRWLQTPRFTSTRDISHVFDVLRPDFTPLHMAVALGIPDLCQHLLKQGVDVNFKSVFGTPLHCAIAGLGVFDLILDPFCRRWLPPKGNEVDQPLGRLQTARILLKAGAKPQLHFLSHCQGTLSSLSLVALSSYCEPELEIAVEIIKSGIDVEEEELASFQQRYNSIYERDRREYTDGQTVVSLLEALGPPDTNAKNTPRARLYNETLEWAAKMKIKTLSSISAYRPADEMGDDEAIQFISLWVKNNDAIELGRFLESSRSQLAISPRFVLESEEWSLIHQNSTALHLAVYHSSLDALHALLDHGFDANVAALDGKRPVHVCHDEDILQTLLRHGASTLVSDNTQETAWHTGAKGNEIRMLQLLIELEVRQEALRMVSSGNETPICSALNNGNQEAVLLLLKHCNSRAFWKSGQSIFRAAAEMGSSTVLKHLLDIDIELDGMDDTTGNPLHYLSKTATVECIQLLKGPFPLDQRRKEDLRTPLESLLLRAATEGGVDSELWEAMLPSAAVSSPNAASNLWSFLGYAVSRGVETAEERQYGQLGWLQDAYLTFIRLGIMAKYEEERKESALLPLASALVGDVINMYDSVREGVRIPPKHDYRASMAPLTQQIVAETRRWDSAVSNPDMVRLLSLVIRHNDKMMIPWLIEKGVDMHSEVDILSPFEFACFSNVPVDESTFEFLSQHASIEKATQGNKHFVGCGPLHFTQPCVWKLKQLLDTGVNPDSPLSAHYGSPLAHHIHQGSITTAEMLLDAGADPWARGSYPFDAPLEAVCGGHHSILAKIAAITHISPCWDQIWVAVIGEKKFVGGNALHLAAVFGNTKCLEFYLDKGLLSNLECHDDDLETPIHYAARFGHPSAVKFLGARGANINAKNRNGWTPLHFAAWRGSLETARALISLGAKHEANSQGCVPLVFAYGTGNSALIEALQSVSEANKESSSPITSAGTLRLLTEAMYNAIRHGDLEACKKIHALGCPVNIEMNDGGPVTLLAVAICNQEGQKIVEWLIGTGATVSTVFPQQYQGQYSTALEAAVAHPSMNNILPELLNKHLNEGANFLDLERSPLHVAIEYRNLEGLKIVLKWLRDTYKSTGDEANVSSCLVRNSLSRRETLSAFVNQHHARRYQETALHLAAQCNDINACAALISSLANTEEIDAGNYTPLHVAALYGSLQAAECLLQHGARPNPLNMWTETPFMSAYRESQWELVDLLTPYCQDMTRMNYRGENVLHYMTMYEPGATREKASLENFSRCIQQGASLYSRSNNGVAPIHWILTSQSSCYLQSLLNTGCHFLRPQEIAQWPYSFFLDNPQRLNAISKNLSLVLPLLGEGEFHQLVGIAERGSHSLLCEAACSGWVEVIRNFLALGSDMIKHQCNHHGTPLTAAVSNGRVEAVKCLVRNGATVPYDLFQPSDYNVKANNPDFVIREWLFIGRFLERMRISNGMAETSDQVESWAGVRTVKVPLKWEWKRHRGEDIWAYAARRQSTLWDVRGKVVKCVGETADGHDASADGTGDDKEEKFSGRYYFLGRDRIRGARLVY